jgi:tRNA (mo5U34)-methyltransferase
MAKRTIRLGEFGLTVEIPERIVRAVRRARPGREASTERFELHPTPEFQLQSRAPQIATARAFAAETASAEVPDVDAPDAADTHPWYHTIEFPDGLVTQGRYDHRELLTHYGFPSDLNGERVLDVGSGDGFWAFELERRGGEVTSLDIETFADVDLPPAIHALFVEYPLPLFFRRGFHIAHRRLGSKVKLVNGPIYDLDPEAVGKFDFVHAGDILLHLRDPALALQRLHAITSGECLIADCFDPALDALGAGPGLTRYRGGWDDATWWAPALSTLVQMVSDAGFRDVRVLTTYRLADRTSTEGPWRAVIRARA